MANKDFVVKNGLVLENVFVANSTTVTVSANLVVGNSGINANGSFGTNGQYLTSNGSSAFWSSFAPTTITANGGVGTAGQVLTSAGSGSNLYWSTLVGVNTASQYTFSNTITFANTLTSSSLLSATGNVSISTNIFANGAAGSAGQVLTSAGAGSNAYWATLVGVNTASQYTFSNTITFSNTVTIRAVSANSSLGTAGQVLASNGTSTYWATVSTSASGSNTQIQFNDSTAFAGSSGFTFDKTTNNVTVGNTITVGTATVNSTIYTGTALGANNSTNLGGAPSSAYVNTSGSYTLGGNITFNGNTILTKSISANGTFGSAGQFLTSAGTGNAYWSSAVTSVSVTSGQLAASYSGVNPTLGLATTAVTPGSYTLSSITVDAYGRITSASSGSASGVTSLAGTAGRTTVSASTGAVTVDLATAGAGAQVWGGSGISSVTLDAYGRVISVGTASYATTSALSSYALTSSLSSASVNYATSAGSASSATSATSASYAGYTTGSSAGSSYNVYCYNLLASADVYAYYSDIRLKTNIRQISNPLDKINQISGIIYNSNDVAAKYGYSTEKEHVGVIAQEVQKVLPQVIGKAPFDLDDNGNSKSGEDYMTVQYDKLVPLLIEGIKELSQKVDKLTKELDSIRNNS